MNADSLEVGVTYFRISYADVNCTMPAVEPMVYVGVNFFGEDSGEGVRYYFQDPVSVIRFGLGEGGQGGSLSSFASDAGLEGDADCFYSAHGAEDIGEVIVDLHGLAFEIDSVVERAKNLSYPRLAKAKGSWI
jgi:hypothetical protein